MHECDRSHGEGRHDELYDYPYNDKHKAEPVVGVRQVEEEEPEPVNVDIDDGPNRGRGHDHPPTHAHTYDGHGFGTIESSSVDIGISGDQGRWTMGHAPAGGGSRVGSVGSNGRPASIP